MYWMAEAAAKKLDFNEARYYFLKLANDYPKSEWALMRCMHAVDYI